MSHPLMKLHLITATVVAYTLLTVAWICYNQMAF